MLLIEAKDYNDMSRKAANIISAQVIMKPHAGHFKADLRAGTCNRIYPGRRLQTAR